MLPQLDDGSWMPRPSSDNALSPRMKPGIDSVAATIAYPITDGMTCRSRMRGSGAPSARAASTDGREQTAAEGVAAEEKEFPVGGICREQMAAVEEPNENAAGSVLDIFTRRWIAHRHRMCIEKPAAPIRWFIEMNAHRRTIRQLASLV